MVFFPQTGRTLWLKFWLSMRIATSAGYMGFSIEEWLRICPSCLRFPGETTDIHANKRWITKSSFSYNKDFLWTKPDFLRQDFERPESFYNIFAKRPIILRRLKTQKTAAVAIVTKINLSSGKNWKWLFAAPGKLFSGLIKEPRVTGEMWLWKDKQQDKCPL